MAAPDPDGTVILDGATWRRLAGPASPAEAPPGPRVARREVQVSWDGEVLGLRARWRLEAPAAGWVDRPLLDADWQVRAVRVDGRTAPVSADGTGVRLVRRVEGPTEVEVEAVRLADPTRGPVRIRLLPAPLGTVEVITPDGLEGRVEAPRAVPVGGGWWTGAETLELRVGPPRRPAADRGTLAVARVGVGLTVGEGALQGRARVRWALRQGRLARVALRVADTGEDLSVSGANVADWSRTGDRVVVELRRPVEGAVTVELSWTRPLGDGETDRVPVPRIAPEDAFRTTAALQIARDADLEILPRVAGWSPVAASELPPVAEGLVRGTPTASFTTPRVAGGYLDLLRFVPVSGPPLVVDVASVQITASLEGRTLTRAHYTVRNEQAAFLRLTPPPGARIVGIRVQDAPVTPSLDGATWRIPLPRSLETVDGLLAFPIEVILLGEGTPWARRAERELPVPAVDAPVAVLRTTVHLPRGWIPELEPGEHGVVEAFTEGEGLAYGFGLGGAEEARADRLWQEAQAAYMRNAFDEADGLLDQLEGLGARNENLGRLRSNLDVVQGRGEASGALARRVRDQARSRALDDYREQAALLEEAERRMAAGDYDEAEAAYGRAAALSEKLDKVEQTESVEQDRVAEVARANVVEARKKRKVRRELALPDPVRATATAEALAAGIVGTGASTRSAEQQDREIREMLGASRGGGLAGLAADGGGTEVREEAPPADAPDEPEPAPTADAVESLDVTTRDAVEILDVIPSTLGVGSLAAPTAAGGRVRLASGRRAERRRARDAAEADKALSAKDAAAAPADGFAALQVTATRLSVVVPVLGETLRFQHLLLPAGAAHAVHVEARTDRATFRRIR